MDIYLSQDQQDKINNLADLFHKTLYNPKENGSEKALQYLIEERKISHDMIKDFNIGFYPANRKVEDRVTCRGRLIFPIVDEYSNVRAFSGRFPCKTSEVPEGFTHWIHEPIPKKFFLYGLNLAWPHILETETVIIVEGQLDVISCRMHGIKNVVAAIGSSLTEENIAKLLRFANVFYLMFDSDEAGEKAYTRTKEILDKYNIESIKIPLKYKGKHYDPDDFLKNFGPKILLNAFSYFKNKNKKDEEKKDV